MDNSLFSIALSVEQYGLWVLLWIVAAPLLIVEMSIVKLVAEKEPKRLLFLYGTLFFIAVVAAIAGGITNALVDNLFASAFISAGIGAFIGAVVGGFVTRFSVGYLHMLVGGAAGLFIGGFTGLFAGAQKYEIVTAYFLFLLTVEIVLFAIAQVFVFFLNHIQPTVKISDW